MLKTNENALLKLFTFLRHNNNGEGQTDGEKDGVIPIWLSYFNTGPLSTTCVNS